MRNIPKIYFILFLLIPFVFGGAFLLLVPTQTSTNSALFIITGIAVPIIWAFCGYYFGRKKVRPSYAIFLTNILYFVGGTLTFILGIIRYFVNAENKILDDAYYYVGFFTASFAAALAHISIDFTGIGYNVIYMGIIFMLFSFILGYFTGFSQELSKSENALYDRINANQR